MENEQVKEWADAQKIVLSIDLVEAAKTHLKFLAAVQRNQFLFEDSVLQRAIYRYNACWLPMLAKHLENPVSEGPLVVPFDCELIWHCHRLNPLRYKFDCEKLYGRILGNYKVMSSLQVASKSTSEETWYKMYPEEPFELDLQTPFSADVLKNGLQTENFTSYDLVDAVKRQMAFTYQACRPHMSDELYLQEAMARYKGFLHLIRTNRKMSLHLSSVPTCDIDLMWHTHQLYPVFYCTDMKKLTGIVVQHNDSHPDKGKGSELDTGFHDTTKRWEQTFGLRYWKAGVLSKGNIPIPVTNAPYKFNVAGKECNSLENLGSLIQFPALKTVEVLLEFVDIKNLPGECKENLFVAFSKKGIDKVFKTKRLSGISSASRDKMFALFQCKPKGDFLLELVSYSLTSKSMKLLGSCSLSFEEVLASGTQLSIDKWVSIDLVSDLGNSEPVLLHVAMSFSPPTPAPQLFQLVQSKKEQNQAHVLDDGGKKLFSVEKGNIVKDQTKDVFDGLTEVYCILHSGEKHPVIEFQGNYWSVKGTNGSFKLQKSSGKDNSLFELIGYNYLVKVFPGRKLEFEPKELEDQSTEQDFMTAVEFSSDYPYGRAVTLINTKSGTVKTIDESVVLTGVALVFMLSNDLKAEDVAKNEGLRKATDCACAPPCKAAQNIDLVTAADCACGPCNALEMNEGFEGQQVAGKCSIGTCYWCQNMSSKCSVGSCVEFAAECGGWCHGCIISNKGVDVEFAAECGGWCYFCTISNKGVDIEFAADCGGCCDDTIGFMDLPLITPTPTVSNAPIGV